MRAETVSQRRNIVGFAEFVTAVQGPGLTLTLSSRSIRPDIDLMAYLKVFFMYAAIDRVESIFGSTAVPSPLYGGRPFDPLRSLTTEHLRTMEQHGIGLGLTLSNHLFDEATYQRSRGFLERYHMAGNSVICVSDALAQRLRQDYPHYVLKASVIKNTSSVGRVHAVLDTYDYVVIPMDRNDDDAFLERLPEKHRIILFGNAGCAYNCPARTCWFGFSQDNQGIEVTSGCSKERIPRPDLGMVYFDVHKLREMGFTNFKLIPKRSEQAEAFARLFSDRGKQHPPRSPKITVAYPECGPPSRHPPGLVRDQ